MGNCCSSTPTVDNNAHVYSPNAVADDQVAVPRISPQRPSLPVATNIVTGNATPESMPEFVVPAVSAEPQQLEHIADREGLTVTVACISLLIGFEVCIYKHS